MLARSVVASALFFAAVVTSTARAADPIEVPTGPVILVVKGLISAIQGAEPQPERAIRFDRAALEKLAQHSLETFTDWTEGRQTFHGVLLSDLLRRVGATGTELRALALNDYEVNIPVADAEAYQVLLALKHNGEYMRIRDKGPIWIIYPNDRPKSDELGPHNDKMVWQLRQLEVR